VSHVPASLESLKPGMLMRTIYWPDLYRLDGTGSEGFCVRDLATNSISFIPKHYLSQWIIYESNSYRCPLCSNIYSEEDDYICVKCR
jgi:hypothetical protein